jgi:hypothetical protein
MVFFVDVQWKRICACFYPLFIHTFVVDTKLSTGLGTPLTGLKPCHMFVHVLRQDFLSYA